MRQVRAVVYGVGTMNSVMTRLMLEKGVTIVGAIARSPEKVGRDLGEVAGLGQRVGVAVEDDADAVLSRSADIAMVAVNSLMSDQYEHLRRCAEHGVNALTLSEEALYPWRTSPAIAAELDAIAKANGVTLTGSGHEDCFAVNIVAMLMGTAHRVEQARGRLTWNVDDYGPEVAGVQRVGTTVEDFEAWRARADRPPTFGRNTLDALAAAIGLTPTAAEVESHPVVAESDRHCEALGETVPAGRLLGYTDIDTLHTAEGPVLTLEMSGWVFGADDRELNEWHLRGEPDVNLLNDHVDGPLSCCAQMVNRIPDVIEAPAGFVTADRLPQLGYRARSLGAYLR